MVETFTLDLSDMRGYAITSCQLGNQSLGAQVLLTLLPLPESWMVHMHL